MWIIDYRGLTELHISWAYQILASKSMDKHISWIIEVQVPTVYNFSGTLYYSCKAEAKTFTFMNGTINSSVCIKNNGHSKQRNHIID